ncbi:MAG: PilW family protein [Patescibacteria group bacterium UBA2163]
MKNIHNATTHYFITQQYRLYRRGLTLIEALVWMSIFSIIMSAIIGSVIFFYRANTSSLEQGYQIESARRGTISLVRDLRQASYGDNGAYPLAQIASTSLMFYSDTDKDDVIERIRYTLDESNLYRHVLDSSGNPPRYTEAGATTTVSSHVRNLESGKAVFQYYDAEGNEVTDYTEVAEVRSIVISLVVNILPIRAPEEFTLQSSATLRNLRK